MGKEVSHLLKGSTEEPSADLAVQKPRARAVSVGGWIEIRLQWLNHCVILLKEASLLWESKIKGCS